MKHTPHEKALGNVIKTKEGKPHAKMGKNSPQARIKHIGREINKERVSYGELAELQGHKKHILRSGDARMAEAAGISESEFNRYQNRKKK